MLDTQYLIRLDDACPTMHAANWARIEAILDKYEIKPMVGVIPSNKDSQQELSVPDTNFWMHVKSWKDKGWSIALHGYDHCYISNARGINPLWPRSEFAGVPVETQKEKILCGLKILASHNIYPKYFFAPSHTFDENTLSALRENSDIRIISDTIALKPYRKDDFTFIPQVFGHCVNIPIPGTWTFCLHPSAMDNDAFKTLDNFLTINSKKFISFEDIKLNNLKDKSLFDRFLSNIYFFYRRLRGL